MALRLDNLQIDILHQVCRYLYFPYLYRWDERWYEDWREEMNPAVGLLPLSLVCKRLRAQTLPWIFRDVTFSLRKPPIPSDLWPYILVFRFCDVSPLDAPRPRKTETELIQVRRDVGEQLARLPSVHTVHLWISSPSEAIMHAILTALKGRLSSLVIYNYPLMKNEDLPPGPLQGIRRLIHVEQNVSARDFDCPDEPRHEASGELLFNIVESSSSSLEHLDIPAQHTRLDRFGGLQMSSLRTLVLRGRVRSPGPNLVPIFMNAVPNLRILEVHLHVIGCSTPEFTIMTEEVHTALEERHTPIFPNLRELTLANASPFEYIILHLPSDLKVLSLAAVPFYDRYRRFELALSANAASHVLTRCPPFPLPELKISIQGELPLWLFEMIADAFPSLERLELRHRSSVDETGKPIPEEHSLEAYAMALAMLPHLRVLNFDWPMTNIDNPDEPTFAPDHISLYTSMMRWRRHDLAAFLAQSMTSLREIGFREKFMATRTTALPWLTFIILRSGSDSEPVIAELNNDRPDYAERCRVSQLRTVALEDAPL